MPLIACDVAKATLDAAWFDDTTKCWCERARIPNNRNGWQQLLRWLKSRGVALPEWTLIVEATGVYHRPLADFAYSQGLRVIVSNPGRAAENARSHGRLNKNDRLDARGLSDYGRELKKIHEYVPDSPEISILRALLSRLRQLDKDRTREQNRLEKCPFIAGSRALAASIRRQIHTLEQEQARIQSAIDELLRQQPALAQMRQQMHTIPGVNKKTSQWLLPLLYRQQFTSARQLAAFLGLTPVHKRSGTSLKKRGCLSGRGNAYLRSRLYMPAVSAITHNPELRRFYDILRQRGKTPKQALTAVMRKLVHLCYGVVTNNQPYQPEARLT
jgi:transposase